MSAAAAVTWRAAETTSFDVILSRADGEGSREQRSFASLRTQLALSNTFRIRLEKYFCGNPFFQVRYCFAFRNDCIAFDL